MAEKKVLLRGRARISQRDGANPLDAASAWAWGSKTVCLDPRQLAWHELRSWMVQVGIGGMWV